jgi:hypothetical protein
MEIQNQGNEAPSLSEHEQAMVDKVEANEQKTQVEMQSDSEIESNAPDNVEQDSDKLLAGKYKSPEDLEKAYKELEAKLGKGDDKVEEVSTEAEEGDVSTVDEAKEIAESRGIEYGKLEQEFADNGQLSEDTYKDLADRGIPKEMVDSYIAGQEARAMQNVSKLQAIAGGEQGYTDMIGWATENLSEAEQNAFNTSMQNDGQAEFAIQGLYSRFKATQGPNLVKGNSNTSTTQGYASKQEMTKDMHSPEYKRDPAFRAQVQRKVAKSSW